MATPTPESRPTKSLPIPSASKAPTQSRPNPWAPPARDPWAAPQQDSWATKQSTDTDTTYENDRYEPSFMTKPDCTVPDLELPDPQNGDYVPLLLRPAYEQIPGYRSLTSPESLQAPGGMNLDQLREYLRDPFIHDAKITARVDRRITENADIDPVSPIEYPHPDSPIYYSPYLQRIDAGMQESYPEDVPPRPLFQLQLANVEYAWDYDLGPDGPGFTTFGAINDARNMIDPAGVGVRENWQGEAPLNTVVWGTVAGQAVIHNDDVIPTDWSHASGRSHNEIYGVIRDNAMVSNSFIDFHTTVADNARVIASSVSVPPSQGEHRTSVIDGNAQVIFSEVENASHIGNDDIVANAWDHTDKDGVRRQSTIRMQPRVDEINTQNSVADRAVRMYEKLRNSDDTWANPDQSYAEHLVDPTIELARNPAVRATIAENTKDVNAKIADLRTQLQEAENYRDSLTKVFPEYALTQPLTSPGQIADTSSQSRFFVKDPSQIADPSSQSRLFAKTEPQAQDPSQDRKRAARLKFAQDVMAERDRGPQSDTGMQFD